MLMVIFGAGASYDSSPDFPPPQPQAAQSNFGGSADPPDPREAWRPPLTNNLFLTNNLSSDANHKIGAVVLTYPRLHGILPFLRQPQNGRTVEQQLELYLDEAPGDLERRRQLLSVRYYIHDLFRMVSDEWLMHTNRVTNYAVLIDQIRHLNTTDEPVCLVSFNYDRLLDHALFSAGAKSPPLEHHFESHSMFKVFKPHGCVDWARLLADRRETRLAREQLIEQAPDIKLSNQYVLANATDPRQMFNFSSPIVPAIAIPVQTKTEDFFEWPDSHREYFEQILPRVTKILVIGWRGKEAHFLRLLREKLPTGGLTQLTHLQVVGKDRSEASDIIKQFTMDIDRNVKTPLAAPAQGFSQFVQQGLVDFFFHP